MARVADRQEAAARVVGRAAGDSRTALDFACPGRRPARAVERRARSRGVHAHRAAERRTDRKAGRQPVIRPPRRRRADPTQTRRSTRSTPSNWSRRSRPRPRGGAPVRRTRSWPPPRMIRSARCSASCCCAARGEAVGLRWADADLDAAYVRVRRPIVLVRGAVTESTPKTKTGDRLIWLDAETVRILKEHRTAQLKARLMAGKSWRDNDLIFCGCDGTPYKPDAVSRRFKRLAALAGLP